MEFNNQITRSLQSSHQMQAHVIQFQQDAIFYGSSCIDALLEGAPENNMIDWHIKEGEGIFKDQSCGSLWLSKNTDQILSDKPIEISTIIKLISYLSGVKTLAHCYAENSDSVPIIGSHTEGFHFWDWELKALKSENILASPCLPEAICKSEEEINEAIKNKWSCIAIDSNLPMEDIKKYLDKIPSSVTTGIYGDILPKDLETWNQLSIDVLWPTFLQGQFPYIDVSCLPAYKV